MRNNLYSLTLIALFFLFSFGNIITLIDIRPSNLYNSESVPDIESNEIFNSNYGIFIENQMKPTPSFLYDPLWDDGFKPECKLKQIESLKYLDPD